MSEQRRKYIRIPTESMTYVEVLASQPGQVSAGRVVACNSLDISQEGLQVVMEEPATVGAILQIGIVLPGEKDILYLVAEVRWCLPHEDEGATWMTGFRLLNANGSDIERWTSLTADLDY